MWNGISYKNQLSRVYTHATSKCAFQNDWGASIRGASMIECRPPSELAQRRSGVPQTFPLGRVLKRFMLRWPFLT